MITFLPKQISNRGILIYLGTLTAITLLFHRYAMRPLFIALGIAWVVGFFLLSTLCSRRWQHYTEKHFRLSLFFTALSLRWLWVVVSYFFYLTQTGMPFEFNAADALGYWEDSVWLATSRWDVVIDYLFTSRDTISDSGYLLYLTLLCKLIGINILPVRMINALFAAASILLIYNLGRRNIGEAGGRLAAIMACFMPNLIYYCGLHLKETIMIALVIAFLERTDYVLRSRTYNVINILLPVLLIVVLFSFRTVIGIVAVFSVVTAILFYTNAIIGRGRRFLLIAYGIVAALVIYGGTIRTEVESTFDGRNSNQMAKRASQTARGNLWAKYATGTVMAPMMFVMPFPTMVNLDEQYNQQIISGGNYVRNFLGIFVLIAVFSSIFITKNWRNLSLIGSFVFAYLLILSFSAFSNSERFLLPALPGLLIMASYGVTLLSPRNYKIVKLWYYIVPLMSLGWAYFKLGSRGLF